MTESALILKFDEKFTKMIKNIEKVVQKLQKQSKNGKTEVKKMS